MDVTEWAEAVESAAEQAIKAYKKEVKELIEGTDDLGQDGISTLRSTMASQDVDAWFTDAHLDFLIRFTEYEELELNRLIARTTDATQNEDEYQTKILVENVAKEKAEADKRVEEVTHRVGKSLERDAREAAKNLAYGLKRAGCDAKEFKKKMNESVTQVEITTAKALDEIYGGDW